MVFKQGQHVAFQQCWMRLDQHVGFVQTGLYRSLAFLGCGVYFEFPISSNLVQVYLPHKKYCNVALNPTGHLGLSSAVNILEQNQGCFISLLGKNASSLHFVLLAFQNFTTMFMFRKSSLPALVTLLSCQAEGTNITSISFVKHNI